MHVTPGKLASFKQMLAIIQGMVENLRRESQRKKAAAAGASATESIASTAKEGSQASEDPGLVTSNGISQETTELAAAPVPVIVPSSQPAPVQAEDPTDKLLQLLQPQHRQRPPSLPPAVFSHMEELREKAKKHTFPLPNLSYARFQLA